MLESGSQARQEDYVRSRNLFSVHRFQDQVEDVSMVNSAHLYHVGIFIR